MGRAATAIPETVYGFIETLSAYSFVNLIPDAESVRRLLNVMVLFKLGCYCFLILSLLLFLGICSLNDFHPLDFDSSLVMAFLLKILSYLWQMILVV